MSEYTHTGLQLVARHVKDDSVPQTDEFGKPLHAVSGFFDIGTEIEGVFVPLTRRKAAGLLADIERARQAQSQPEASSE